MRVRTPAIRCDRPTIQGLPAFSPAQCPRVGGKRILPQRTFSCDAKDHARLRKDLGQNIFSKRGIQVEFSSSLQKDIEALAMMTEISRAEGDTSKSRLGRKLQGLQLHRIAAEEHVHDLSGSSFGDTDWALLLHLQDQGRAAAD